MSALQAVKNDLHSRLIYFLFPQLPLHVSDANCPTTGARSFKSLLKDLLKAYCVPGHMLWGLVKEILGIAGEKEEEAWRDRALGREGGAGWQKRPCPPEQKPEVLRVCVRHRRQILQGPEKLDDCI